MTFLRDAGYKIDAERDGKPMTGYGKNGEIIESPAFRPWAPGWKVELDHPADTFRGTMPSHSAIG